MNIDEMKNRISLALKDPTLQQGFEIICKNLAKLEKENAELKAIAENQQSSNMERYFKNKDLEKQLNKATEIIKKLYAVYYDPCETESDFKYRDELFAEVKQFLSEVEK